MNYFLILLSLAGVFSLKEEKNIKRKNYLTVVYLILFSIAVLFILGYYAGQMIYKIQHVL